MLSRPKIERGYKAGILQGRETLFPNVLPSTYHDSTKPCPSEQAIGPNVVLSPLVSAYPPEPHTPCESTALGPELRNVWQLRYTATTYAYDFLKFPFLSGLFTHYFQIFKCQSCAGQHPHLPDF